MIVLGWFARRLRGLMVAVLILVAVLVAADRGVRYLAQRELASRFQSAEHLKQRPDVSFGGFPFLTQLARGRFTDVHVSVAGLVVGTGKSIRISHLDARLHGVKPSSDLKSASARSATGTALIAYRDLSQTVGTAIAYAGPGRVKTTRSLTVAGVTARGSVSAQVRVRAGTIEFVSPTVDFGGVAVPTSATAAFLSVFDKPISLRALPAGLQIRSAQAGPDGVTIVLTATDAVISTSGG